MEILELLLKPAMLLNSILDLKQEYNINNKIFKNEDRNETFEDINKNYSILQALWNRFEYDQ